MELWFSLVIHSSKRLTSEQGLWSMRCGRNWCLQILLSAGNTRLQPFSFNPPSFLGCHGDCSHHEQAVVILVVNAWYCFLPVGYITHLWTLNTFWTAFISFHTMQVASHDSLVFWLASSFWNVPNYCHIMVRTWIRFFGTECWGGYLHLGGRTWEKT